MDYPWDIKIQDETHMQNSNKKLTVSVDLIFHDIKKEDGRIAAIKDIIRKESAEFMWQKYDEKTETATARVTVVSEFSEDQADWLDMIVRELAYSVHAKAANIKSVDVEETMSPTAGEVESEVKQQDGLTV
jgi:hypothetical protein